MEKLLQLGIGNPFEDFLQLIQGYIKAKWANILEIGAWLIPLRPMKATFQAINGEGGIGGGLLDCFL
jgi:hypothetical protein